jgi:hypothetical protein
MKRRLPQLSEVARFAEPTFRRQRNDRWSRVQTVADFKRLAQRKTPRVIFDYVEGAAENELSRDRATAAFGRVVFHPHALHDVSTVDTSATILERVGYVNPVSPANRLRRTGPSFGTPHVLGEAGALAGPRPGTLLVEMTTCEPSLARELFSAGEARGVDVLDAPVSGGDVGAREAKLVIMVGANRGRSSAPARCSRLSAGWSSMKGARAQASTRRWSTRS